MKDELHALENNKKWSIVKLPPGKKVVGSRWVYKTKFKDDGSIERHKAILVARGFTQTFGVDYKETFALVVKMNIVKVLLSVAVNCSWPLHQMDVKMRSFMGIYKKKYTCNFRQVLLKHKYVVDLLNGDELLDCKPAITPFDSKLKLDMDGEPFTDVSHYQRSIKEGINRDIKFDMF
ncbi:uncharacterized mitochondrial protein AtMg00820-like [Malus domestica]|uniref:uncharacterized mitochondrial protein AtMg00820-like n=1 Tax=Malus domestica TaxID=3750 RepID=UPI003975191F